MCWGNLDTSKVHNSFKSSKLKTPPALCLLPTMSMSCNPFSEIPSYCQPLPASLERRAILLWFARVWTSLLPQLRRRMIHLFVSASPAIANNCNNAQSCGAKNLALSHAPCETSPSLFGHLSKLDSLALAHLSHATKIYKKKTLKKGSTWWQMWGIPWPHGSSANLWLHQWKREVPYSRLLSYMCAHNHLPSLKCFKCHDDYPT